MKPKLISEAELQKTYKTTTFLKSGGDYGCGAAVFEGDLVDNTKGTAAVLGDAWWQALNVAHPDDVGTVLVTGDLAADGDIYVCDRLMCLVVLGSVKAKSLRVFETEVWIGGTLEAELHDRDEYVTVKTQKPK